MSKLVLLVAIAMLACVHAQFNFAGAQASAGTLGGFGNIGRNPLFGSNPLFGNLFGMLKTPEEIAKMKPAPGQNMHSQVMTSNGDKTFIYNNDNGKETSYVIDHKKL